MLIGYVSDERYVALPRVLLEFENEAGRRQVESGASGIVEADLAAGPYRVTLYREGFGSKRVEMTVDVHKPHQFRLLRNGLLGYAWPKWVQSGDLAEFR